MKTDDTQAPNRAPNNDNDAPNSVADWTPKPPAQPGHHLVFVVTNKIGVFGESGEPDNDAAPNPVADWTPDCDGRVPNQRLIRLGKAFVELREGVLSEGQLVEMTGLDRITVREIDDLFNQAVTGLEEALGGAAQAPAPPDNALLERLKRAESELYEQVQWRARDQTRLAEILGLDPHDPANTVDFLLHTVESALKGVKS